MNNHDELENILWNFRRGMIMNMREHFGFGDDHLKVLLEEESRLHNEAKQAITKNIDRAVLEARIDELKSTIALKVNLIDKWGDGGGEDVVSAVNIIDIQNRLAELKSQGSE